jgi:FlaG/FlaF family flagellin (archaellin)
MTLMPIVATILLAAITVVCLVGCFSHHYGDNLLQRIGLASLGVASLVRAGLTVQREYASFDSVLLYAAILAFAIGTIQKVHYHCKLARPAADSR